MNSLYYLGQAFFLFVFHLTRHAFVEEGSKNIIFFFCGKFLKRKLWFVKKKSTYDGKMEYS